MTGTLDGAAPERPVLHVLPGGGGAVTPADRPHTQPPELPITIMLSGRVVDLFRAALADQRVNPTRGTSQLDMLFAALEVAFEAVKADTTEDRPPFVVNDVYEHHAVLNATVHVFTPVAPPDPPPRCG